MTPYRRSVARLGLMLLLGAGAISSPYGRSRASAASIPDDDKTILHVLNRIGFGARPGDVDRVRQIGLERYIEQQLHPDRVADAGMDTRLTNLSTLRMSQREIVERIELPDIEARRARRQANAQADANGAEQGMPPEAQRNANRPVLELAEQKVLRAAYSDRQLQEVLTDFWFNHFNVDARKGRDRFMLTTYERDAIRPHVLGKFRDLLEATAKSPAMLFYLDNWMSADPNGPHLDAPAPFPRGRFGAPRRPGPPRFPQPRLPQNPQQARNAPRGLNENYGRELMELHTLGVDGGYTQKDVTEVARAFTGWTIENPRQGGSFEFNARIHDPGEKTVLGHRIKAGGGIEDGEQVLDILAAHPSTARFISTKLVRRFVSDTPPPALVDRAAARFRQTGGDLREVMRTILTSPEFLSPDAYRAKVKTPFEFVVSSVRATGAEVEEAQPLVRAVQQLGMPLYQCQPPTGYKDTSDGWVNTGALVARMNFAVTLTTVLARRSVVGDLQAATGPGTPAGSRSLVDTVLADDISDATRSTIAKATEPSQSVALTLGSPEFQRR